MKFIRIFLLVLIIIGIGLLLTQKVWVPKLVSYILEKENYPLTSPANTNPQVSVTPILRLISQEEYMHYANLAQKPEEVTHEECNLHNYGQNSRCEEKYLLAKYPKVVRVGQCLEITLLNESKKRLCDVDVEEEGWGDKRYSFSDYMSNAGYLFDVLFWEGSSHLLINEKTGEEMEIFGKPIFSPSEKQFLAVSVDLEAGYNPNGFQIWQREGDSFVKKVGIDGLRFGVVDPVWKDEHSFYFVKTSWVFPENEYVKEYAGYSF